MSDDKRRLKQDIEIETVASAEGDDESNGARSLSKQIEKSKSRQRSYLMDLRVHSPASIGYLSVGGIDTAPALVRLARVKGLDMIAVTDFHSAEFVDRVINAAKDTPLTVIPGVVIRCTVGVCEDAMMTCLFPESAGSQKVTEFLRSLGVPKEASGDRRFLVKTPFTQIVEIAEKFEGVLLPSRMDKTPNRKSAIPLLVNKYGFRAFDLAYPDSARYFRTAWPKIKFHLFCFSNAHALAQIGSRMAKVKMAEGGFTGIRNLVSRQGAEG